jgi:hypothetical protein
MRHSFMAQIALIVRLNPESLVGDFGQWDKRCKAVRELIIFPPLLEFVDELHRFLDSQMPDPRVGDARGTIVWGAGLARCCAAGGRLTRHPC